MTLDKESEIYPWMKHLALENNCIFRRANKKSPSWGDDGIFFSKESVKSIQANSVFVYAKSKFRPKQLVLCVPRRLSQDRFIVRINLCLVDPSLINFLLKLLQWGLKSIYQGKLESPLIKVSLRMTFLSRQSSCVVIVPSQLANHAWLRIIVSTYWVSTLKHTTPIRECGTSSILL